MKCPGCHHPLRYKGGANKRDFGCSNPNRLKECPCWVEAHYYPHMSVLDDWWFGEKYALPFKVHNQWYCIEGPRIETKWAEEPPDSLAEQLWPGSTKRYIATERVSYFKRINIIQKPGLINWNNGNPIWGQVSDSTQTYIVSIPYMALPVNEDFWGEFQKLINHKAIDRYVNKLAILAEK